VTSSLFLTVPCPTCGAGDGEDCPGESAHWARRSAARARAALPKRGPLSRPCPSCGAAAGQKCVPLSQRGRDDGKEHVVAHPARR